MFPESNPQWFYLYLFLYLFGFFLFLLFNKTVPDFHDSQNSFRVFVENMDTILLQTC